MKKVYIYFTGLSCIAILLAGCSLFGLDVQEDYDYEHSTYSDQLNMNVWDFMQSRKDMFSGLIDAVTYLENDSATGQTPDPAYQGFRDLYTQSGNTYMLLTNAALTNLDDTISYWYKTKVKNPAYKPSDPVNYPQKIVGFAWKAYPKAQVAELLKYHILKGTYDYPHLNSIPAWIVTYASADSAKMQIYLSNDRDGIYYINTYSGSPTGTSTKPRTPCLIATNGVVNVMNTYLIPPTRQILGI